MTPNQKKIAVLRGAPLPPEEEERLRELVAYGILDTAPEPAFDRIAQLAARVFHAPMAVINFIADDRQWFKSCLGLSVNETPRAVSICAWAILTPELLVIPDTRQDERIAANPFVTAENGIQFYAGAPLITPRGYNLGTLCVLDTKPRPAGLSVEECATLADLAAMVIHELELRASDQQLRLVVDTMPALVSYVGADGRYRRANQAYREWFGLSADEVRGRHISEVLGTEYVERVRPYVESALAGQSVTFETRAPRQEADRYLQGSYTPDRDETGRVRGFVILASDITEKRRIEQEVRKSEERLRTALDAAQMVAWEYDPAADTTTYSDSACQVLGFRHECPVRSSRDWHQLMHPADVPRHEAILAEAIAQGSSYVSQFRFRRIDTDEMLWVEARGEVRKDPTRATARVSGVLLDITDRKRAELRDAFLAQLDRTTRPLTDPAEITLTVARLLGQYLEVNRCAYAEVEADENTVLMMGDYHLDVSGIAGRYTLQEFGAACLESMREGRSFVIEDVEADPHVADVVESYRLVQIRSAISAPLLKAGRLVAGMAVHQKTPRVWRLDEIELVQLVANRCWESVERSRVERERQESEGRFRTMADHVPILAWMAHADGHLFWYNRRWYEYTGTSPEQMDGWGWQSVHDPHELPRVLAGWRECIRTGDPFELVFPLRGADGQFRSFLTRVVPVRDRAGEVVRWFGTNTDISDQKRTEKELRQANADLESFAFAAAHDLQEPLRMVTSYTQLLERRLKGNLNEDEQEFMGQIVSGAKRMSLLLQDLLAYTETGRDWEQEPDSVDLNRIVLEAVANCRAAIEESGAEVMSEPLPSVLGRALHFEQLFQNLIGNAVKYRGERTPTVRISVTESRGEWQFAVKDNGLGIAPEHHERVFGVFKRLHGREIPGTGIGLAICQRVVERYGGRIWVESAGKGHGSAFCFTLPMRPAG